MPRLAETITLPPRPAEPTEVHLTDGFGRPWGFTQREAAGLSQRTVLTFGARSVWPRPGNQ